MPTEEVYIRLPAGYSTGDIPPQYFTVPRNTSLFRDGDTIHDLAVYALKRFGRNEPLSVLSVGCSVGAEADSLLTLLKSGGAGPIDLIGVDVRKDVIDCANKGQYETRLIKDEDDNQRIKSVLSRYGFTIVSSIDVTEEVTDENGVVHHFNSLAIRNNNSVDFRVHDLAEEGPIDDINPDLVIIHNLLYQIPTVSRRRILERIFSMMNEYGILSLDGWMYEPVVGGGDDPEQSTEDKVGLLDRYQGTGLFQPIS